jgi:hypothetical protein
MSSQMAAHLRTGSLLKAREITKMGQRKVSFLFVGRRGQSVYNILHTLKGVQKWNSQSSKIEGLDPGFSRAFHTVARYWRGFYGNPTIKFRSLAKNSAIFLAFRSYVIKSCFGNENWFCLRYFR